MTQNHETSFHLFCSTVNCRLKLKFSEDLDKCGYPSWTKLKIWKGARRLLQVIRERRTSAASAKTCDDLLCVRIIRSPEIKLQCCNCNCLWMVLMANKTNKISSKHISYTFSSVLKNKTTGIIYTIILWSSLWN